MKKFNELSHEKQTAAYRHFLHELKSNMASGLIDFGRRTPTEGKLQDYAQNAAEIALYLEPGDHVVSGLMGPV